MALPEGYRPREGDVLQLRGTVRWTPEKNDDRVHVKIEGSYRDSISVPIADVVLERRAWSVGEKVSHRCGWSEPGEVVAVYGASVWVVTPGDEEPITVHANDLVEWYDPKAPLIPDEETIRSAVSEAMAEPPPAPAPETKEIAFSDDEGAGAVLLPGNPEAPAAAAAADDDDLPF